MFAEIDLALTPTGWLAYLGWLLVFLPLAYKSFSVRVSVASLRYNAVGYKCKAKTFMHTPQVRLYLMVGHCALPGKSGALCMPGPLGTSQQAQSTKA